MSNHGIHHVTAVTSQIRRNLRFFTETLGLRLVKKSVNQDDVSAYHLFYADKVGTPGTDMTFFDWERIGPNVAGLGTISRTTFRAPTGSLEAWQKRLEAAGVFTELGEGSLLFSDPEGQRLELVEDDGGEVVPWTELVPEDQALRGILGVDLESARPDSTALVLTDILGFEERSPGEFRTPDGSSRVRLPESSSRRMGSVGAGGVHHVAFRVKDDDELVALQEKVEGTGLQTSGQIDRFWFHSVYFREPGGILFELATDGPGFGLDESMETLGEKIVLAPFLEPQRAKILAGLKPLD
jgi:glyoxalase family protein